MSTGRQLDPVKINQIFQKIHSSDNLEIEERNVRNLAQKLSLKLIDVGYLVSNHSAQIQQLFEWLNKRGQGIFQGTSGPPGTICSFQALQNFCQIFQALSLAPEGRALIMQCGGKEIFNELINCVPQAEHQIIEQIQKLMKNLVEGGGDFNGASTFNQRQEYESSVIQQQQQVQIQDDMRSEFTAGHQSNMAFSRREFSAFGGLNDPRPQMTSKIQESTINNRVAAPNNHAASMMSATNYSSTMGVNQSHIEIMHKQQVLKEKCELPFVVLTDQDEKMLFDLSVALKFGNISTIYNSCQKLKHQVFQDFPPEIFLQRTDILKALLDLLEGGQAQPSPQGGQDWDSTTLAQQCLLVYVQKLSNTYKFLTNNSCKPSIMDKEPKFVDNYIEKCYPSNRLSRWERQEERSYQAAATGGGQNSLSAKAILGLILTKSIYLLQDTDKIGLILQLIRETFEVLEQIFRVRENPEFTEFLHLCLFAFDKVCDFYREQLFEEVLVQPVLQLILKFVDVLNSIPEAERFKNPFTETLFKNTENLQRTIRRCLFRYQFSEENEFDKYQIILKFFERLENGLDHLQRNVQQSFFKAQNCFAKFVRVTQFRIETQGEDGAAEICFVRTSEQLSEVMLILRDLTECGIELKLEFPFEHLLVDSILYAGLLEETKGGDYSTELEKLTQALLAIPLPEIRERILRKIYQRLRAGNSQVGPKSVNNTLYLSKFILRKGMLNHFVNGILINRDIAQYEESQLQMNIGQLVIKILILAFNENSYQAQQITQFLLTFHCLLPHYNELISLIELIEESGQKNCRYLRVLRDLFSTIDHKREFATNVLRSSFSQDGQEEHLKDVLKCTIDLREPSGKVASMLDLINSNFDFSSFGVQDITKILQSSQQDYGIKKSSLEQLTMILFDIQNKRGRFLFSQTEAAQDVFTYVLDEVLAAYNSSKNYLKGRVSNLPKDQVLFINECMRFMFFSYVFFNDEPIVQSFFNKVKSLTGKKHSTDPDSKFEQLLHAIVYFMGCALLRENCVLLLYVTVYQQLWICTKQKKSQAPNGQIVRELTILIPDFCQDSLYQLLPYTVQTIRMPARDDLMLSEEQKMYIEYRFTNNEKLNNDIIQFQNVAYNFEQSVQQMKSKDYRQVLKTGVDLWKNYLISSEQMNDCLINQSTLTSMIELMKLLPTRDYEYYDLADFLDILTQILTSSKRMISSPIREAKANFEEFLIRLMDALKFHLIPYLEETGVSQLTPLDSAGGVSDEQSPKCYLLCRYLELINAMIQSDICRQSQFLLRDQIPRSMPYLIGLFQFFKNNVVFKRLLIQIFWFSSRFYGLRDTTELCDVLVDQVSQTKMIFDQFEHGSLVMWSLRIMITLSQKRQLRLRNVQDQEDDTQANGLSSAYQSRLEKFKSFGWIMRFTETRDARLRVLTWDLLTEIFDYEFLRSHPSIVHQSVNTFLKDRELYCVKISVLKFINKVCQALIKNCEDSSSADLSGVMSDGGVEQMTVQTLLQTLNRQGLISQIHKILSQKDCPLLFLTLTLQLLFNLTQMDYKKAIPVLTQLDYWTFLVELLDVNSLIKIEVQENREILDDLREQQLNFQDPCQTLDLVYMTLNSILDFLFSAFKRDSQLAALLVKTTKLMQSVFILIKQTLDNDEITLKNKGLLTVFIDKIIKIMHVAMLHPQDYSVDLISKFIFEKPIVEGRLLSRNWAYFIKMFEIIEKYNQTMDFTDIKLAIIRFIAEFLIQTAHFETNHLDELLYEQEAYGCLLFIEFAKVFKSIYIDQRCESENQKKDIAISLCILLSCCQSSKTVAVDQNFIKKVIDICSENASAIYLSELQRYQGGSKKQLSQEIFDQRFKRQSKYACEEIGECEREVQRMLQLVQHLFFDSRNLLVDFVQKGQKLQSQSDKLLQMFAQILEELGTQKQYEPILAQALIAMITFSSQNVKFKNTFVQPINVSTQSKKISILKIVVDKIVQFGNIQVNSRILRLYFTLVRSLSTSDDIAKEIMKHRLIEDVSGQLLPQLKSDKDIKLSKFFLLNFMSFLSAFTSHEEGQKQILKVKNAFEVSTFILDTVNVQPSPTEMSPLQQLIAQILLFVRNSTIDNRSNKVHFLKNDDFLPSLLAFLSERNQHPKIKAYAASVLWSLVHNHQGVKAMINKSSVISELQLLKQEYQRQVDKSAFSGYLKDEPRPDYHSNYAGVSASPQITQQKENLQRDMEAFIAKALQGVLTIVQSA